MPSRTQTTSTVNEFDNPWIRNMLEMQMTIFELIQDLEKIAEMRDQIRKVSVKMVENHENFCCFSYLDNAIF